MDKKSQLTLIIIVGIMLVFSTAVIIYLQQQAAIAGFQEDKLSSLSSEMQPVKIFVDKCISQTAIPGIYYMGTQGGYISPPLNSLLTENSIIPYYYTRETNQMPSLSTLENEISQYIETTLTVCTGDFSQFALPIIQEKPRVTTKILEQKIMIKIYYPLTMKHPDGKDERLENFVIDVPIRMGHIYNIARNVVDRQIKNPDLVDLAYLSSFDGNVDLLPYDGTTTIFAITDGFSKIQGVNYQLFFANNLIPNSPPKIDFVPDFVLSKGVPFEYTVKAKDPEGDKLRFSSNSQIFTINPESGVISFTPTATGIVEVTVNVTDTKGKQDQTKIRLDIK